MILLKYIALILIFPSILNAKAAKQEIPSFIKLRAYGETYHMNATVGCWAGGWTPDSLPAECICVKGIWAVSTSFCDTETTIYTGDGHCFRMDKRKRVRKMFNLDANKLRPFSSNSYAITADGHDFAHIRGQYQNAPGEEFAYLIRTNPKKPMFVKLYDPIKNQFVQDESQCTPSVKKELKSSNTSKYIFIADISGKNHFNLGSDGWCPKQWMRDYWVLTVGQSFRLSDQKITEGKIGKPESCPSPRVITGKRSGKGEESFYFSDRTKSDKSDKFRKSSDDLLELNDTTGATVDANALDYNLPPEPHSLAQEVALALQPQFQGFGRGSDYDNPNFDLRWPLEATMAEQVKQLDVQTARLGSYFMEWTFNQDPGPKVNTVKEFEYLRMARKLMLTTCKSEVVTPTAVNNLFRWFRWLSRESLSVYSYPEYTDDDLHQRLMTAVSSCVAGAQPMTFQYDESCGSDAVISVTHGGQKFNESISESVQFDIAQLEPSIEFIWKIMMNVHYYCADYFTDNPTDHSALNVRYEAFFSPLLRKRWENPAKTFELMSKLWSTYRLTPIFEAIDICVATSRAMSTYKEWLVRPINEDPPVNPGIYPSTVAPESSRKKRDIPMQKTLWGNHGYCLEDTTDAVTLYGAVGPCVGDP